MNLQVMFVKFQKLHENWSARFVIRMSNMTQDYPKYLSFSTVKYLNIQQMHVRHNAVMDTILSNLNLIGTWALMF